MFWHGSSFGYSQANFINCMMGKTMIVGTCGIFYNIFTGFSAGYFVEDLLFLLYNLVTFGFYPCSEVSINRRYNQDNEKNLPLPLSQMYAFYRDEYIKRMMRRYIIFSFFMYYGGFVAYYVTYAALEESSMSDGKTTSIWTTGLVL